MVETRLIAPDAGVDLVGFACVSLEHEVRVGQEGAGHADEIRRAGGEDVLSGGRCVDPEGRRREGEEERGWGGGERGAERGERVERRVLRLVKC